MKEKEKVFVAPGAVVLGDVTLGENVSIWYHATVRGDSAPIAVGRNTNIQDNCVVHTGIGYPVHIGENVTVGHSAIVHGCRIGDNALIGMGAILLNGCSVGRNSIIGAGALVTEHTVIPDNSLALGSPARVVRQVTREEIERNLKNTEYYVEEARGRSCSGS